MIGRIGTRTVVVRGLHAVRQAGILAQVVDLFESAPDPLRELVDLVRDVEADQAHAHRLARAVDHAALAVGLRRLAAAGLDIQGLEVEEA